MGIVVGATSAQLKRAGIKVAKGVRATAESLGLKSEPKTVSTPRTISGELGKMLGSVKPSIPNTVSIPSQASGIIMTAGAVGKTETGKGLAQSFVDLFPELPGTQVDNKIKDFIVDHPIATGVAAAAAVATTAGIVYAVTKKKKPKKKSTKKKSTKKKSTKKKSTKKKSKKTGYGTEAAYNRKGGKKVYYTKNKQPYVLLASGKARFIKKSKR